MKSLKSYLFLNLLLSLLFCANISAIDDSDKTDLFKEAKRISDEAFLKFDKSLFIKSNGIYERILSSEPENLLAKYYMSYNHYRLITIAMNQKDFKMFDAYFNRAVETLKYLQNEDEFTSEAQSLLAAIYMMKLALDKTEAASISMAVHDYLGKAEQADKNNPRVHLIRGIMLYNTPEMFGGSIDGALNSFNYATKIYEQKVNPNQSINWGHIETLAWKGQALVRKKDLNGAKSIYEKALEIEPNFGWVKYGLLPTLEKKVTSQKETTN